MMLRNVCSVVLMLAAVPVVSASSISGSTTANPIRKIVGLLQDMQKEIQVEMDKEKELFDKFMCICTEYPSKLAENVETCKKNIAALESQIESETAEQSRMEQDLTGHYADKAGAEKDLEKATALRGKEQAEAEAGIASSKETLASLSSVLPVIEKGAAGGASAALLQGPVASRLSALIAASSVLTPTDKDKVTAFLAGESQAGDAAQDYAPESGQIVGILKQMKDDMAHSITEQTEAEVAATKGYNDLKSAKDEEIAVSAESISTKEKHSGDLAVSIASAKDNLEDVNGELTDAQEMLSTLASQCGTRKQEFEARLKMRTDEISAISEAIKVLNDDDALDVFKSTVKPEYTLVQTAPKRAGFLQQRSGKLGKAVDIVRRASQRSGTHLNALLQSMIQAQHGSQSPDLSGIDKMIDGMIALLKKEQAEDEEKKDWCFEEVKKAESQMASKQDVVDTFKATSEELADNLAGFNDDLKALEKSITDLDRDVAESTELRKKEHVEYTQSVQMLDVAVQLLEKAKNKLNKFYNPSLYKSETTPAPSPYDSLKFVQLSAVSHHRKIAVDPVPDLPEVPELKKQNSGGIIALMNKIANELVMDKQEAEFEEKTAQRDYVKLMDESAASRAQYVKAVVEKKGSKSALEANIIETKEKMKLATEELMNAHQYVADVHQSCDFLVDNFQAKQEARTTELEALQEAKAMLHGATF